MASVRRHPRAPGRWQVRWRDDDGNQKSQNFRTKAEADAHAAAVETDKRRGEYVDPVLGRITVEEYAKTWQRGRSDRARSTRERDGSYLRSLILPTFGRRSVASVRRSQVATWLAEMDRAPATRAKALQILAAVCEVAKADGAIKTNPCDGIDRPRPASKRPGRALTDEQVSAIIAAAEEVDPRNAALVYVMARMGLRSGEAIALKRSDVDAGVLHVRRSMSRAEGLRPLKGRSDGDEGRSLPMPADVAERLRLHLADTGGVLSLDGFLFVGARGRPIRYTNWRSRKWAKIVEAAGVEATPHSLRHTVTTNLFTRDGWTVPAVQAYMGHVDPSVTLKVYTHLSAADLPRPSAVEAR